MSLALNPKKFIILYPLTCPEHVSCWKYLKNFIIRYLLPVQNMPLADNISRSLSYFIHSPVQNMSLAENSPRSLSHFIPSPVQNMSLSDNISRSLSYFIHSPVQNVSLAWNISRSLSYFIHLPVQNMSLAGNPKKCIMFYPLTCPEHVSSWKSQKVYHTLSSHLSRTCL